MAFDGSETADDFTTESAVEVSAPAARAGLAAATLAYDSVAPGQDVVVTISLTNRVAIVDGDSYQVKLAGFRGSSIAASPAHVAKADGRRASSAQTSARGPSRTTSASC